MYNISLGETQNYIALKKENNNNYYDVISNKCLLHKSSQRSNKSRNPSQQSSYTIKKQTLQKVTTFRIFIIKMWISQDVLVNN